MKKNMSGIDRIIRILVAVVIGYLFYDNTLSFQTPLGIIAAIVAGIFFVTALVSSCPLYSVFGFSSCPIKR